MVRYVIFGLDETLVHSDAVRRAFCSVAAQRGIGPDAVHAACDAHPGCAAAAIFEALGYAPAEAAGAGADFLRRLEELDRELPAVPYADAEATLRAMRARGAHLILSTGSTPERAQRVLDDEGWGDFELVLGSEPAGRKGPEHFRAMSDFLGEQGWTAAAATIGDRPSDMRLGLEHGVPVRIGLDRCADADALRAAGATHVVRSLSDAVALLADA